MFRQIESSQLNENRESKNINLARKYVMGRGYSQKNAQELIDNIRHDIPNSRLGDCKFLSGIARMCLDGELQDAKDIMNLNKTLKIIATNAHINEYDSNLNNMSFDDLIGRFATNVQQDLEKDMERSSKKTFQGNSDYQIVRIPFFEDAENYASYTDWCITRGEENYNSYTHDGEGIFYFCLKNGYQNIPKVKGENTPLDEYGLSMIAVSVNSDGSCNSITCRWNHENGGNDSVMTPEQLESIINKPFYETFVPRSREEILIANQYKAATILEYLNDESAESEKDAMTEYVINGQKFYVWSGIHGWYDSPLDNAVILRMEDNGFDLAYNYAFDTEIKDIVESKEMECGFYVVTDKGVFDTNTMTYLPKNKKKDINEAIEQGRYTLSLDRNAWDHSFIFIFDRGEDGVYIYREADKKWCPLNPIDKYYGSWIPRKSDKTCACFLKGGEIYTWQDDEIREIPTEEAERYLSISEYFYRFHKGKLAMNEEVSIKPFEPKENLNPEFWKNNKLDSRVRLRLLDIADDFVKTLDIRWVKPEDIVLTGSIANYNWTKYSDVDIHIIMDFKKVYPKKTDFVKSYFDSKKNEWNSAHEDLKIFGFNVEMSVEDLNAPAAATGVYSLEKNDWVKEPKDLSDAKLNVDYIKDTAEKYIDKIDKIEQEIKKETDRKKIETLTDKMVAVFDKLKGMRKEGLKSASKEMSSGNIIWKVLRASGYLEKIWDVVNYNYDRSMSLDEAVTGKDNKKAAALYVYAMDKEKKEWCLLCAKRADRKNDEERGKWNPTMGHLHRGEDMIDGAIRECFEESGIDCSEYKKKIKLMDSHRWGNNYRLIIKDKTTDEIKIGKGDEENDKFRWLPVSKISKYDWAWSCGEKAKEYIPKTVILNEEQINTLKRIFEASGETMTLYHGVNANKLEYNLQNDGFVPRVCAEGGPEAVYLSEKQYNYQFTFKFDIPKDLLGKKLFQQTTVDYTFDDFISFDDFNCELVATNLIEHVNGFAVKIDLFDIEMCKRQIESMPEALEKLEEEMSNYPLVYKKIIKPKLDFLKKS